MYNSHHILDFDCNSKETGPVYPQIQQMSNEYDSKANNSIKHLFRNWKSFPNFIPNLESFVLEAKSKQTDALSHALSNRGIIINSKAKSIFESVRTCPVQFYKASVVHKKELLDNYFWMHIISDYTDFVDYKNSSFFIYKNFMINLGYIKVSSKEDLIEKEEKLKTDNPYTTLAIWSETIKMLPSFDLSLQFFKIGNFDSNIYIGDSLKKIFLDNQITGFKFTTTNKILF